ncbi:MAG: tetratricopeptide repeat protein, partial [Sulfitobacter sp.]|nr:tetratricopeptide repeat protein [Sulfitobacter sp.]
GVPERHILLDSVALKAALRLAGQTEHLSPDQVSKVLGVTAARFSSQGDNRRALEYAQKALAVARDLADTNPAAFTPDLAMSLNNLAARRSEGGDRAGALEAINEAVQLYTQLADTNSAAFTPDLAMSLNNLANRRSEAGDRAGALEAINEAVQLYTQLADTNPAAFTPNLATSLNNLAAMRSEAVAPDQLLSSVVLSRPVAKAWLQGVLATNAEGEARQSLLRDAADLAGSEADDPQIGLLRQQLRRTARLDGSPAGDWPVWIRAALEPDEIEKANSWIRARTWDERESWIESLDLNNESDMVAWRDTLEALQLLHPENAAAVRDLQVLLGEILDGTRLTEIAEREQDRDRFRTLIVEWTETRTWQGSRDFYRANRANLDSDTAASILESLSKHDATGVALQHAALLTLLREPDPQPVEDVFSWAADPFAAFEAASRELSEGAPTAAALIIRSSPAALNEGHGLLTHILSIAAIESGAVSDDSFIDQAGNQLRARYEARPPTEREAALVHVRDIASTYPTAANLNRLLPLLEEALKN